jgi:hypothetical protein
MHAAAKSLRPLTLDLASKPQFAPAMIDINLVRAGQ